MIPTLKEIIQLNGRFVDIEEFEMSMKVYDDILLVRSLNDMNRYQMIERPWFIQKRTDDDFDYLLQDSQYRTINKQYSNINFMTIMNAQNNNFKIHPFINEEQLQSILAIKNSEFKPFTNLPFRNFKLEEIGKTHKKLSKGLNKKLVQSINDEEYIHVANKESYKKLNQLWLYLYDEINSYNLTNQLISYVALEKEYSWAFLNELFYLIDQYVKSIYDIKEPFNKYKKDIKEFVKQYVETLLLNLQLPNVRLWIIRGIVDECEREKNPRKKMDMIENLVKNFEFVGDQYERFENAMNTLLKTTVSIEMNAMKNKLNYFKDFYCPRDKTKCKNIEFNVSLFFEAIEVYKKTGG